MRNTTAIERALLLTALATAVVGCLNPSQVKESERLALGDPRLAELLDENEHAVEVVRRPSYETRTDVIVEVAFAQPVEEGAWPLDACDIGRVGGITGVRWLVDIRDDEVLAVTPVWGAVTCFRDI